MDDGLQVGLSHGAVREMSEIVGATNNLPVSSLRDPKSSLGINSRSIRSSGSQEFSHVSAVKITHMPYCSRCTPLAAFNACDRVKFSACLPPMGCDSHMDETLMRLTQTPQPPSQQRASFQSSDPSANSRNGKFSSWAAICKVIQKKMKTRQEQRKKRVEKKKEREREKTREEQKEKRR